MPSGCAICLSARPPEELRERLAGGPTRQRTRIAGPRQTLDSERPAAYMPLFVAPQPIAPRSAHAALTMAPTTMTPMTTTTSTTRTTRTGRPTGQPAAPARPPGSWPWARRTGRIRRPGRRRRRLTADRRRRTPTTPTTKIRTTPTTRRRRRRERLVGGGQPPPPQAPAAQVGIRRRQRRQVRHPTTRRTPWCTSGRPRGKSGGSGGGEVQQHRDQGHRRLDPAGGQAATPSRRARCRTAPPAGIDRGGIPGPPRGRRTSDGGARPGPHRAAAPGRALHPDRGARRRHRRRAFRHVGGFRVPGGQHLPGDRAERAAVDGGGLRRHRSRPQRRALRRRGQLGGRRISAGPSARSNRPSNPATTSWSRSARTRSATRARG